MAGGFWKQRQILLPRRQPIRSPIPLENITCDFDAAWNFPADIQFAKSNQMNAVNPACTTWSDVANINFQLGPASEIVLHLPLMANILIFWGLFGNRRRSDTSDYCRNWNGSFSRSAQIMGVFPVGSRQMGFIAEPRMNPELIFDPTIGSGGAWRACQLIVHEIGRALGLRRRRRARLICPTPIFSFREFRRTQPTNQGRQTILMPPSTRSCHLGCDERRWQGLLIILRLSRAPMAFEHRTCGGVAVMGPTPAPILGTTLTF